VLAVGCFSRNQVGALCARRFRFQDGHVRFAFAANCGCRFTTRAALLARSLLAGGRFLRRALAHCRGLACGALRLCGFLARLFLR
jgi:hypothetical protein